MLTPIINSWFLPTHRDSRSLSVDVSGREPDVTYLEQVVLAADALGHEGVLVPTGTSREDPWIVSAFAGSITERLKFLLARSSGSRASDPSRPRARGSTGRRSLTRTRERAVGAIATPQATFGHFRQGEKADAG
ncbi:MAG TPA: LLM class flavin-dependent oxidoreductase [Hyphomicrobium sp.]|nr:LLM class flavin-dependent oxidoreductase [Hyphomicrobium sp.]